MTVKTKICGLKTPDMLETAVANGADYVGFVHYPRSPRHLELERITQLIDMVRGTSVLSVVLLVDPDDETLQDVARSVEPSVIQLHGLEDTERVRKARKLSGRPIVKALGLANQSDLDAAGAYFAPGEVADEILFDAKPPADPKSLPGGNGLAFDWRILAARPAFPFWLAGGLTPENVSDAIRLTRPAVVDVSSGVETSPGIKDAALIRRFLHAAKTAKQQA